MKKTLLIAAAALVAGIVTSEAQVYSANIVGYVNVVCPPSTNVLIATPLTTGNDVLTNVIQGAPGNTIIQFWNPVNGAFSTALSFTGPASNRHWKDGGGVNQDNYPVPVGTGYFVNSGGAGFTNTYVGSVVANAGVSVTNVLTGGTYLVGGAIPFADSVTNKTTINLIGSGNTVIEFWNPTTASFNTYSYTGPASNRTWKDSNNNPANPALSVAQGFFILPGGTGFNWVQTNP